MSFSFTQLIGTSDTTSPTKYGQAFTTLANNNSAVNVTMGKALVNSKQRYYLQKYFDNERTYSMPIIGSSKLTFTGALSINAVSATLNAAWALPTVQQLVNFSSGDQRLATFIKNSAAITWDSGLAAAATTAATTVGVRDYPIPANISKLKDVTVTIGQLVFTPKPVQTRTEWDYINTLPYISDIPQYYFVWGGTGGQSTVGIWPIPSTPNNVLTFNSKIRTPDMTFDDFSTGNITTATVGSYAIVGTGTNWSSAGKYPLNTNITFLNLNLRVDPPYGDGIWYLIQSFQSDTSLTLAQPILNAPGITAASTYTIGQLPTLQEDFHDSLVYGSLAIYYSSIVKDEGRFKMYESLEAQKLQMMEDYLGTKQVVIDLEQEVYLSNPNLFPYQSS